MRSIHVFIPILLRSYDRALAKMMLPTKSTLQWSCVPHLVTTQPTIIFLHAAMLSAAMFDETVTHLSSLLPAVNLLLVDLNDHGKITSGRKNFTLWDQADDVIALMVSANSYCLTLSPPG